MSRDICCKFAFSHRLHLWSISHPRYGTVMSDNRGRLLCTPLTLCIDLDAHIGPNYVYGFSLENGGFVFVTATNVSEEMFLLHLIAVVSPNAVRMRNANVAQILDRFLNTSYWANAAEKRQVLVLWKKRDRFTEIPKGKLLRTFLWTKYDWWKLKTISLQGVVSSSYISPVICALCVNKHDGSVNWAEWREICFSFVLISLFVIIQVQSQIVFVRDFYFTCSIFFSPHDTPDRCTPTLWVQWPTLTPKQNIFGKCLICQYSF